MRILNYDGIQVHISEDSYVYRHDNKFLEEMISKRKGEKTRIRHRELVNIILERFTRRKLFQVLLELYGGKHGLKKYILLDAHGGDENNRWVWYDNEYYDIGKGYPMQEWINGMDGQTLAILLFCCNPSDHVVHSEKSVIIHTRRSIWDSDLVERNGLELRFYVPGEGYLEDNPYGLSRAIDRLR